VAHTDDILNRANVARLAGYVVQFAFDGIAQGKSHRGLARARWTQEQKRSAGKRSVREFAQDSLCFLKANKVSETTWPVFL
jgi:hypothetical protein